MSVFTEKAPRIMRSLIYDFPVDVDGAAAIVGNLGHESGGLEKLQEINPTVPGSRGGYGWAQWTGPRRRAFEAYCKRNGLFPSSDVANYKYLFVELKGIEGSEGGAIRKMMAASGLKAKTIAFERAFLRAGIKHDDSRLKWAERAKEAYLANPPAEGIVPRERPPVPVPEPRPTVPVDLPDEEPVVTPPEHGSRIKTLIAIAAFVAVAGVILALILIN